MKIRVGPTRTKYYLSFGYNKKAIERAKATFSGTKWDGVQKRWEAPVNGRNFNRVKVESGESPWSHLLSPVVPTNPSTKDIVGYNHTYEFFPHQQEIYDFVMQKKNCVIAGQMRVMKTLPVLCAVDTFVREQEERETVWYLAPKSAVRGVRREFNKWFGIKFDKQGKVLPPKYGGKQLPYDLVLINYEKWSAISSSEGIKALVPRVVIFDEVHRLKGDKTKVGTLSREVWFAQALKYGTKNFMLIGMSGTPAPKDPTDWWNILETIVPGYTKWSSKKAMMLELAYCEEEENEVGQKYWKVVEWLEDKVNEFANDLVGKVSLPIFKKDVLDLPDKVHDYIQLPSSRDTKDAVAYLRETVTTAIELINKCRQISDGFLYEHTPDEESGKNVRSTAHVLTPKSGQLKSDLQDLRARGIDRVVVLAGFKASVDTAADICIGENWETIRVDGRGARSLNSPETEDWFFEEFDRSTRASSKFLALVGHPKSVATGLELSATPVMIYWSHTNDGEAEFQSVERAHSNNMDKEMGLTIKHYCHLAVDKQIIAKNDGKENLQGITMGTLLDALRAEEDNV